MMEIEGNVTAAETESAPVEAAQAQPEQAPQPNWDEQLEQRLQNLVADRERALIDQFNRELAKRDQSRDDQLLNRLQKRLTPKYQAYDEVAKEEGWTDDKLAQKKQAALATEFQEAMKEVPPRPVPLPQAERVQAADLEGYIQSKGLDPKAVDYSKYVGLERNDPQGVEFYSLVGQAVQAKKETTKETKVNQATTEAQQVANVKKNFGGTATPSASPGGSVSADSLIEEYDKLVKQTSVPLNERPAYYKRLDEIEKTLKDQGRW